MAVVRPSRRLGVETLESRDVPAAVAESFQTATTTGLPAGWSRWASDPTADFHVDPGPGLGDNGKLVSSTTSASATRAWLTADSPANVETSAAVFLDSVAPVHLFVRGANPATATASYYAVSVVRGAEVQLVKVVSGQMTVLGAVRSVEYMSGKWATINLRAEGDKLRVSFYRGDTNQYLMANGTWTSEPVAAIERTDVSIRTGGKVGFARPMRSAGTVAVDSLRVGPPSTPAGTVLTEERFARGTAIPSGWSQYAAGGPSNVSIATDQTLRLAGTSGTTARAWANSPTGPDVQASASVFVDGLVPAGVFARGSNLTTEKPTYYAVTVARGVEVKLTRVVAGASVELGTIKSKDWLSGTWLQVSLIATGDRLQVQIFRSDTGQYLNADGSWGLQPVFALTKTDGAGAIRSGGKAGLSRGTGYAGELIFDNFILIAAPGTTVPSTIPTAGDKPTTPPAGLPGTGTGTPEPTTPTTPVVTPTVNPALPVVPRNYEHIRLANLAYFGTPLGPFEKSLLRNSIDLVVPNLSYLPDVNAANPNTPQLVYTNVSNIYLGLLTDWGTYADANGLNREGAFYHVTRASTYDGSSASAVPVNQFWGVYRGTDGAWTDLTGAARAAASPAFGFADKGQAVALGFLEKYREINVDLQSAAGTGWTAELEYVSAVDAAGRPTQWKTLRVLGDSTLGFRRDGQLTFDPPSDWVAASIGGSARLFYTRIRTTGAGVAPQVRTVLGRDYTAGGKIPAFDTTADTDHNGYLSDAEYARRRTGFDARFQYESRLFYPNYGSLRFATNVANPGFRNWVTDYHARFLAAQPLADGFFVDNSIGRLAVDPTSVTESLTNYSADYGSLLGVMQARIRSTGKWLLANTAGGNASAEPIAKAGVSTLEEFALRPVSANHVQFEDLLATLTYRRQLSAGKAYEVLDSLPQGLDANDPRVQMATLAMYYAVADPNLSFLMVNGGNEPASSWTRHWIEAATFDVGKPTGTATVTATGTDPSNSSLTYKVYSRTYQHALVLYKPLSYTRGVSGTTADATATIVKLDDWYRPVHADGSLGAPVRQVSLRNGDGAVLAKVA